MFELIQHAPPDAILGLNEIFQRDARSEKVNLTVGVYKDESGITPILNCVKDAERRLLESESAKPYLGIAGFPSYNLAVRQLLLGEASGAIADGRAITVQTPGGTGACRVAADFLRRSLPNAQIWCSRPTWANHHNIFKAAGFETKDYAYLDDDGTGLDRPAFLDSLSKIPAGEIVCLHGCCHNPTGVDPDASDWDEVVSLAKEHGWLPLIDLAYQGFGSGLDQDASAVRGFVDAGLEVVIAHSYSKNFGLYAERVGALTLVAQDTDAAAAVESQVKSVVRANYSNPPKHGAAIVATILSDDDLTAIWKVELVEMCERIHDLRRQLVAGLADRKIDRDMSFITQQKGMFSYSGLTPDQVDQLKNQHGIYMLRSGRMNVAGLNSKNLEVVCDAMASVMSS